MKVMFFYYKDFTEEINNSTLSIGYLLFNDKYTVFGDVSITASGISITAAKVKKHKPAYNKSLSKAVCQTIISSLNKALKSKSVKFAHPDFTVETRCAGDEMTVTYRYAKIFDDDAALAYKLKYAQDGLSINSVKICPSGRTYRKFCGIPLEDPDMIDKAAEFIKSSSSKRL